MRLREESIVLSWQTRPVGIPHVSLELMITLPPLVPTNEKTKTSRGPTGPRCSCFYLGTGTWIVYFLYTPMTLRPGRNPTR